MPERAARERIRDNCWKALAPNNGGWGGARVLGGLSRWRVVYCALPAGESEGEGRAGPGESGKAIQSTELLFSIAVVSFFPTCVLQISSRIYSALHPFPLFLAPTP